MPNWHVSSLLLALAFAAALAPQDVVTPRPRPILASQIHEDLIAEAPRGSDVTALGAVTTDRESHVVWIEESNGRKTVHVDGQQVGGVYDDVKYAGFRGGALRPSFVASRKSKWMLVVDGHENGDYTKITAPDVDAEGRFAAGVCRDKQCRLLLEDREVGPVFEDIGAPDFSPGGGHSMYFGKRGKKWLTVVGGIESSPEMDDWWGHRWGPDGRRLAVAGRLGEKFTWIVDNRPGPLFDVISPLVFSGDGQHYAYSGASSASGFKEQGVHGAIVVDGQQLEPTYAGRGMPGGWRLLLGQVHWIIKGMRSLSVDFHGVSDPQFTARGELVFGHRLEDGHTVVRVADRPGPTFDDIVSPIIVSPDGKHVVYVGKQGDSLVEVRDQKAGVAFLAKRDVVFVPWIGVSKTGRLMYEIVRGGKEFEAGRSSRALRRAVIDGTAGHEYDSLGMACRVSDVDLRYACVVHGAEGKRDRIVINGLEGRLYDDIPPGGIRFLPDACVEFIARQGGRVLRVTTDFD